MKPDISLPCLKYPWLDPILSQFNPVHTNTLNLFEVHLLLSSRLHLCRYSGPFPSDFPTKTYEYLIPLMCATCRAHPIVLDLIALMIFAEERKLSSSLLCSFLRPFAAVCLSGRSKYPLQGPDRRHPQSMSDCRYAVCKLRKWNSVCITFLLVSFLQVTALQEISPPIFHMYF